MSTELHAGRFYLTRYAGPLSQEGGRMRYQVTIPGEYFSVPEAEIEGLMLELAALLDLLAVEAKERAALAKPGVP